MKTKRMITRMLTAAFVGATLLMVTAPITSAGKPRLRNDRPKVVKRHQQPKYRHSPRHQQPEYRHSPRHQRNDWRPVIRHLRSRPVYARNHSRPWYNNVQRVYVQESPFYFHAGLNVFFGGVGFQIDLGNHAPAGYGYYDPYCSLQFETVNSYHRHLSRHRHRGALEVIRIRNSCDYGY